MIVGLPIIDIVLEHHAQRIASDLPAYRNHVYRVVNVMDAIAPIAQDDHVAVGVAAAFHDIGLWTANTWDYIPPSVAAAEQWLQDAARTDLSPRVRGMIENHHKVFPCPADSDPLVENFRRADWCDVTLGLRSSGLPRRRYSEIVTLFPTVGFHRRLLAMTLRNAARRPFDPLPMFRW